MCFAERGLLLLIVIVLNPHLSFPSPKWEVTSLYDSDRLHTHTRTHPPTHTQKHACSHAHTRKYSQVYKIHTNAHMHYHARVSIRPTQTYTERRSLARTADPHLKQNQMQLGIFTHRQPSKPVEILQTRTLNFPKRSIALLFLTEPCLM